MKLVVKGIEEIELTDPADLCRVSAPSPGASAPPPVVSPDPLRDILPGGITRRPGPPREPGKPPWSKPVVPIAVQPASPRKWEENWKARTLQCTTAGDCRDTTKWEVGAQAIQQAGEILASSGN